ncbi:hypothetical protein [Solibacillus sp. R5-41]|uniref:hypothetical protein n=1 Tax=Solibacillus sp. R5-41 TaxID=2048654 RepID=UPI0012FE08C9|nr:hypothetical protein [Solibacillus sp. R5-41]
MELLFGILLFSGAFAVYDALRRVNNNSPFCGNGSFSSSYKTKPEHVAVFFPSTTKLSRKSASTPNWKASTIAQLFFPNSSQHLSQNCFVLLFI